MIDRIETGIGAIDGMEEGQEMDPAEKSGKRAVEQRAERGDPRAREAINVGGELDLILHGLSRRSGTPEWIAGRHPLDGYLGDKRLEPLGAQFHARLFR